jgi:uncharacterized membrane protein YfhO
VNDQKSDYFRADYVLRSMVIPAGEGTIRFEFRPAAFYTGKKLALASSFLLILFVGMAVYFRLRERKAEVSEPEEGK